MSFDSRSFRSCNGANWIASKYGLLPRLHPSDVPTWDMAEKSAQLYGIPMDPLPIEEKT